MEGSLTVKFYLNHGPQEPEIYIANIPGVSDMKRYSLMKIDYPAYPL
jgi:hypothetical protein